MYSQISLCSYTPNTMMETDNEAKLLNQDSKQSDRFKRSCEKLHCFLWNGVHIQREHCWRVDSLLHPQKKNEITKGPIVQYSREQTRFPKAHQENQKLGHHNITTKTHPYVNQENTWGTESNHTYQTVIGTKRGQREWLSSQYFLTSVIFLNVNNPPLKDSNKTNRCNWILFTFLFTKKSVLLYL